MVRVVRALKVPVLVDGSEYQLHVPPPPQNVPPWSWFGSKVATFCAMHTLAVMSCLELARTVEVAAGGFTGNIPSVALNVVETHAKRLPPRLEVPPNSSNPLAFLHLEKCGGSSLRKVLFNACRAAGLQQLLVAGFDSMPATSFTLPEARLQKCEFDVAAGHFHWGEMQRLDAAARVCAKRNVSRVTTADQRTACIIMLREPTDRVLSYYAERVLPVVGRQLHELSMLELDVLMRGFRATMAGGVVRDNGMSNALFKMLCAGAHSADAPRYTSDSATCKRVRAAVSETCSVEHATRRLQRCVLGSTADISGTVSVLRHWFPFGRKTWPQLLKEKVNETPKERRQKLPAVLKRVVEYHNVQDRLVYEYGRGIFAAQVAMSRAHSHSIPVH